MNFLVDCIKGIAIGSGAILPGISSGVLCVIFGIYEKLLDSILNFFQDIKKNTKFLFPILIGVSMGILIFSNILILLFTNFPIQTKSIFIGLILGSIPSLFKEIKQKSSSKLHYFFYTLIAFFIGVASVFLEKYISTSSSTSFSFIYLIISGFIMSIGVVVPGVSSTIILMLMGVYSTYLSSVSLLYFPVLVPMGIGLIIGCIVFMKLTKFLLTHFYAQTFYSIIGFTLGSIFVLFPPVRLDISCIICFLCILLGFFLFNLLKTSN